MRLSLYMCVVFDTRRFEALKLASNTTQGLSNVGKLIASYYNFSPQTGQQPSCGSAKRLQVVEL